MRLPDPQPADPRKPVAPQRAGMVAGLLAIGVLCAVFLVRQPVNDAGPGPPSPAPHQEGGADTVRDGGSLARQACGGCHLPPAPDELDRFSWAMFALPQMAMWMGLTPAHWTNAPGGERVGQAGVIPGVPLVEQHQWHSLASYYLDRAPIEPLRPEGKPPVRPGLSRFDVVLPPYRQGRPMTTLVKISSRFPGFYLHDAETRRFLQLTADGQVNASIEIVGPVVNVIERQEGLLLTVIGDILPSHRWNGRIDWLPYPGGRNPEPRRTLLDALPRPAHLQVADVNGDGCEDLVVCAFGNVLGRFSWFEQQPGGRYTEHVLLDRAGAVRSAVHDFNGDGRPDILVLMAQAKEGLYLCLNRGGGRFEIQPVVERPPSWGYASFEPADFDGDGHQDVLLVNGDNGDAAQSGFPAPLKRYHGLRIHLNDGRGRFREAWFYPMFGAYQARALDFDQDGDLDIAAISFFPDYAGAFKESFVYLENQGGLKFEAATCAESISGRWMTFDAGDVDGDGDADIVLGAFNRAFRDVPALLAREWNERGPSVLILRNNLRP